MSFFSSPGKYLREALEARRARQRAEVQERREAQLRQFFGRRRNLHDHRNDTSGEEHSAQSNVVSSVKFTSTWKSISNFLPSLFSPKDLEEDAPLPDTTQRPPLHLLSPGSSVGASQPGSFVEFSEDFATPGDGIPAKTNLKDNNPSEERMKSQLELPEICLVAVPEYEDEYSPAYREIDSEIELQPFGEPESIPSGPIFTDQSDCWGPFRCHRYIVSHKLSCSCQRQSRFLKRVMTFLSVQYAVLIVWIAVVLYTPSLSEPIVDNFYYSYLPLGLFVVSKILLRSMIKIRKFTNWLLVLIACLRIICVAYYCGAVSAFANTEILLLTATLILLSHIFFAVTPHFVDYDVSSSEIIGMSAVVNLVFSVLIIFPFTICKFETSTVFNIFVQNWLPSFFASQLIIMFLIFDMKQIMTGWRFPLGEADWIFTVLYL